MVGDGTVRALPREGALRGPTEGGMHVPTCMYDASPCTVGERAPLSGVAQTESHDGRDARGVCGQ